MDKSYALMVYLSDVWGIALNYFEAFSSAKYVEGVGVVEVGLRVGAWRGMEWVELFRWEEGGECWMLHPDGRKEEGCCDLYNKPPQGIASSFRLCPAG